MVTLSNDTFDAAVKYKHTSVVADSSKNRAAIDTSFQTTFLCWKKETDDDFDDRRPK